MYPYFDLPVNERSQLNRKLRFVQANPKSLKGASQMKLVKASPEIGVSLE